MNESIKNRLVGLLVEYTAKNKERNDAAKLAQKTARDSRNAEYGPTLSKEDPNLFPNGKDKIFPNPAGSPFGNANSRAPLRLKTTPVSTGARRAGEKAGEKAGDFWKERQKNYDAANNILALNRAGQQAASRVLPNNINPKPIKRVF